MHMQYANLHIKHLHGSQGSPLRVTVGPLRQQQVHITAKHALLQLHTNESHISATADGMYCLALPMNPEAIQAALTVRSLQRWWWRNKEVSHSHLHAQITQKRPCFDDLHASVQMLPTRPPSGTEQPQQLTTCATEQYHKGTHRNP